MTFQNFVDNLYVIFEWAWDVVCSVKVHFLDVDFYPIKILLALLVVEAVFNIVSHLGLLMPTKSKEETYEEYSRNRFRREKYDLKYNNRHSIRKRR